MKFPFFPKIYKRNSRFFFQLIIDKICDFFLMINRSHVFDKCRRDPSNAAAPFIEIEKKILFSKVRFKNLS